MSQNKNISQGETIFLKWLITARSNIFKDNVHKR